MATLPGYEVHLEQTAFTDAKDYGQQFGGTPASIWMPDLEVAFLLLCPRRRTYDDNHLARVLRHILIYGPRDCRKSTTSKQFLRMCGARDYTDDESKEMGPTFVDMNHIKVERMAGGAEGNSLLMPYLHDLHISFSSELMTFLTHSPPTMKDRMDFLNPILEEGTATRALVKMGGVPKKEKERFLEKCKDTVVKYNPEKDSMTYPVMAAFFLCSRFFEPEELKPIIRSGFLSRLDVSAWDPDEEELEAYHDNPGGIVEPELEKRLSSFNRYAWNGKYDHIPFPSQEKVLEIVQYLNREYRRIRKETGVTNDDLREGREYVHCYQLLTACALERRIRDSIQAGEPRPVVHVLDYKQEDVDRAILMLTTKIMQAERRAMSAVKEDKVRDQGLKDLTAFLKQVQTEGGSLDRIQKARLRDFIMTKRNLSNPSAYERINRVAKAGYLRETTVWGVLMVTDLGFRLLSIDRKQYMHKRYGESAGATDDDVSSAFPVEEPVGITNPFG
jgi:hypothetical protein